MFQKILVVVAAVLTATLAACAEPDALTYERADAAASGGTSTDGDPDGSTTDGGGSTGALEIDAVNGDGSPDGTDGHGANHLRRAVVITGKGLRGATVTFSQNGSEVEATILDATDTMIRALLPEETTEGTTKMKVKRGQASMEREISLLQGEKGDKGDKGDQGDKGEMGLQGPAGEQGPAGAVGPQGPAGAAGAQGPQGPSGPQGPAGAAGDDGILDVDSFAIGQNGSVFVNSGTWATIGTQTVSLSEASDLLIIGELAANDLSPSTTFVQFNYRLDGQAATVMSADEKVYANTTADDGVKTFFHVQRNVAAGNHSIELVAKCRGPGVIGPCDTASVPPTKNKLLVMQLKR